MPDILSGRENSSSSSPPRQAWTDDANPGKTHSSSTFGHNSATSSQFVIASPSWSAGSGSWGLPQFVFAIFAPALIGLASSTFYFAFLPGSQPCELSAKVLYGQRLNITNPVDVFSKAESYKGCWINEKESGMGKGFSAVVWML